MAAKKMYHRYFILAHWMEPPTIEHLDIYVSNFYRKVCNISLKSKSSYRNHYRYFHPVRLKPVILNPDILPNVFDLNNYCKACEMTFTTKYDYHSHLGYIHKKLDIPQLQKKKKSLEISPMASMIPIITVVLVTKRFPQNTCIKCIFCQFIQYLNVPPMKDSLRPEIDDLRFYYRACKQKYKNKQYTAAIFVWYTKWY